VIVLTVNRSDVSFAITGGADKAKFSLSGNTSKVFPGVLDTIANSDGDSHITNNSDGTLGFELVTIDDFKISVVGAFSTPENTAKVIDLTTNGNNSDSGFISIDFAILPGADANKFTLAGNKLTFKATDFEARSDVAYRVKVQATRKVRLGVINCPQEG
jgi:hypothetical protein